MADETENKLTLWKDVPVQSDAPAQPVPEEFPLVDCGKVPWSRVPIREISPQTWFKYQKYEDHNYLVYDVSDGNGRVLFHTEDEEIVAFVVKALNVYVQAAMQTQTQV